MTASLTSMCVLVGGALAVVCECPALEAASERCAVTGAPRGLVLTVSARGTPPFDVAVRGAPVSLTLPATIGGPAQADLSAPLRMTATAKEWSVHLGGPLEVLRGMLYLAPSTELLQVRRNAGGAMLSARIAPWSTTSVTIRGLRVACDALSLTPPEPPMTTSEHRWEDFAPAWNRLRVRGNPAGPVLFDLEVADRASLRFSQRAHDGAWDQVSHRWSDGSLVTGWASTTALRGEASSYEGRMGWPPPEPGCARIDRSAPREMVRIALGSKVYARPGAGQWATVTTSEAVFELLSEPHAGWLRITRVPGITDAVMCDDMDHAWVKESAVTREH